MVISWFTLIILFVVVSVWSVQMRAREYALPQVRKLCQEKNVLWVDEALHLKRLRWKKNAEGKRVFQREYEFEYTQEGSKRYRGRVILEGLSVVVCRLDEIQNDPNIPFPRGKVVPFKRP